MSTKLDKREFLELNEDFLTEDALCNILDVEKEGLSFIKVTDVFESEDGSLQLILYNYCENFTESNSFMELPRIVQESVKRVRGKVVRILESGELELISATFPFTEVLQVEELNDNHYQSPPVFKTDEGQNACITSSNFELYKRINGGVSLIAFRVDGYYFLSSFKKFFVAESCYGSSPPFETLFYNNQDTFRKVEDIFERTDPDKKIVYMFMATHKSLVVDSREKIKERVYFLCAFEIQNNVSRISKEYEESMKQYISSIEESQKLIRFQERVTAEQANSWVNPLGLDLSLYSGKTFSEIFESIKSGQISPTNIFRTFMQNSREIILRTDNGIYTLSPPARIFCRKLINGESNLMSIFCKLIELFNSGDLIHDRLFIPFYFGPETILEIANSIKEGREFHISDHEIKDSTILEKITFNMLLACPISRIDEVLELKEKYSVLVANAIVFMISNKNTLRDLTQKEELRNFPGLTSKPLMKYFKNCFELCFTPSIYSNSRNVNSSKKSGKDFLTVIDGGIKSWWPLSAITAYVKLQNSSLTSGGKGKKGKKYIRPDDRNFILNEENNMAIIAFVCNSRTCLHQVLRLKEKADNFQKARNLHLEDA